MLFKINRSGIARAHEIEASSPAAAVAFWAEQMPAATWHQGPVEVDISVEGQPLLAHRRLVRETRTYSSEVVLG